jgi:hypothetical protein
MGLSWRSPSVFWSPRCDAATWPEGYFAQLESEGASGRLPYEQLSEPERRVWRGLSSGEPVDLRMGESQADDPAQGSTWVPSALSALSCS